MRYVAPQATGGLAHALVVSAGEAGSVSFFPAYTLSAVAPGKEGARQPDWFPAWTDAMKFQTASVQIDDWIEMFRWPSTEIHSCRLIPS